MFFSTEELLFYSFVGRTVSCSLPPTSWRMNSQTISAVSRSILIIFYVSTIGHGPSVPFLHHRTCTSRVLSSKLTNFLLFRSLRSLSTRRSGCEFGPTEPMCCNSILGQRRSNQRSSMSSASAHGVSFILGGAFFYLLIFASPILLAILPG